MIIGITGFNGSGKTVVVDYLQKKSFQTHSLSDVLRDELKEQGKKITRDKLINLGNELREKHGNGVLGEKILGRLQEDVHSVVESIRNPGEVEALQTKENFVLVHIEAPQEIRFERMMDRQKEGETDYKKIIAFEEQELASEDEHKQQLLTVSQMANIVLVNDGDLETLYKKVNKMLKDLYKKYGSARPSWDTYFMDIAKTVAKRSNCMKRKVAAVIIKDKRIVSTGYNGTPRGTTNCNEGGCPRCNNLADGGTNLSECLCSHGEENAIVQAAYHGISLKGSTIYSTFSPCLICAKMIINSGIQEVVYNVKYPLNDVTFSLMHEAGIELRQYTI